MALADSYYFYNEKTSNFEKIGNVERFKRWFFNLCCCSCTESTVSKCITSLEKFKEFDGSFKKTNYMIAEDKKKIVDKVIVINKENKSDPSQDLKRFQLLFNDKYTQHAQESEKEKIYQEVKLKYSQSVQKLEVRQIPDSKREMSKILKTLASWINNANNKICLSDSKDEEEIFKESKNISELMLMALSLKFDHKNKSILVCTSEDTIQSVAITTQAENAIEIRLIVTNPNNIKSESNKSEKNRVRGAPTAIIHHIFQQCLQQKAKKVFLTSVESAIPFYKNLKFTHLGKNNMTITSEEIKSLYQPLNEKS